MKLVTWHLFQSVSYQFAREGQLFQIKTHYDYKQHYITICVLAKHAQITSSPQGIVATELHNRKLLHLAVKAWSASDIKTRWTDSNAQVIHLKALLDAGACLFLTVFLNTAVLLFGTTIIPLEILYLLARELSAVFNLLRPVMPVYKDAFSFLNI